MDEQTTHGEDDLGLDITADEAADTSATDTDETVPSSPEQEPDTLDLGEPNKGKAEAARDKQADAWAKKIMTGEKSLDDLPPNLKWLKPFVETRLGAETPDVDRILEEKLTQREEARAFENLKGELQDAGLTSEQKAKLQEKFKFFRDKGLSQLDSLETAKEALGIDLQEEAIEKKRHAMRLRSPGTYAKISDPAALHQEAGYGAIAQNLTPEKRLEYLRSLKKM